MAFNNTLVARAAASIWGLKLGNATMNAVLAQINSTAGGLNAVLNDAFNASFSAATPTATIVSSVIANLGLTGQAATDGAAYLTGELSGVAATARGSKILEVVNLFSGLTDATYGPLAAAFNAKVAAALAYSSSPGTVDAVLGDLPSATSFNLEVGFDNITGTAGNDTFNAFIYNNSNSLESGDMINGGAGVDTLYADMGASQSFAVTPHVTAVENIVIRGQSRATDSGDNNVSAQGRVIIDAQRISGELRYESNNSRGDVIIEDVRIADAQITKDITIAMVQTDPGNVDFGVYFDQPSLRASSTSSATLTLELLDQQAATEGANPLRDSPYDGFSFRLNGTTITLTSQAFNDAQVYSSTATPIGLLQAIQALLAGNAATNGVVTAALGGTFTVTASNGQTVTGTQIVLSATNATLGTGNWIALAGVPPTSSLYTNQFTGAATSNALITSTIILDDVGRGSNSGDLMIGGLSTGVSSTSRGVERFEITVERNSRLQNVDSTANSLKEVVIKNGATAGLLNVLGNSNTHTEFLPGYGTNPHDTWGFNDVRLIDASAMTGAFTFDALVSTSSFAKYISGTDTQPDPGGDNVSIPGTTVQRGDFIYSGGSGNDSMTIQVDGGIAASNSSIQGGSSDFTFRVNGNAGNDSITFRIVDGTNDGLPGPDNWYQHQKLLRNVTIDSGDGNDTVRTPGAGDAIILLGTGVDTAYVDNTGGQVGLTFGTGAIRNQNTFDVIGSGERAMWTFNTIDQLNNGAGAPASRNVNDILSDANNNYGAPTPIVGAPATLYRATIGVNFMGLTASAQLASGTFRPTDLFVNQAIKAAINNDPVLSKLLVAEDGPAYSLIVKSLIDGTMVPADLAITLTQLDGTDTGKLSETDFLAVYASLNPSDTTPTRAELQQLLDAGKANFDARGDYTTRLARDAANDIAGAPSVTPSDNTITPGTGNDVIVLGTTVGASALLSSNDTVVYSGTFDNDVIVNFTVGPLVGGGDILNLTALGGTVGGVAAQLIGGAAPAPGGIPAAEDKTVRVHAETAGTDTAAEIAALYVDSGSTTTSRTFVYVAVLPTNVGKIYQVVDPAGAANVTATLVGTIDLADTPWATLTLDNFT
jgi:hypothetical protein